MRRPARRVGGGERDSVEIPLHEQGLASNALKIDAQTFLCARFAKLDSGASRAFWRKPARF